MAFSLTKCSVCKKEYLKDNRHINENVRLGNSLYCSPSCFSKAKNKQRVLICENPVCNKRFKRSPGTISFRNFCSRPCAMKIIGPENGMRNKKYRYCGYCGERISPSKNYCSTRCWGKAHQLSMEELIEKIKCFSLQLNRTPTKREFKHSAACIRRFGSWNNALVAAGLEPHRSLDQRMYKRRVCIAKDAHKCDSVSELIIDNWLTAHMISHTKGQSYPTTKHLADWSLDNDTYVEYFGLANDSVRYDEEIRRKRELCNRLGIKLIEIYSKDLFPKNNLAKLFLSPLDYSPNQSLISFSASSKLPEA